MLVGITTTSNTNINDHQREKIKISFYYYIYVTYAFQQINFPKCFFKFISSSSQPVKILL